MVLRWINLDRAKYTKGCLGEGIVDRYLFSQGLIPYHPVFDGSHPFDRICSTPDKREVIITETKTKARRTHYEDTGINLKHYTEYRYISNKHNLRVFLFFVDEFLKQVYGNFLDILEQKENNYPLIQRGIIYFPLRKMILISKLDICEVQELVKFSSRNHKYPQISSKI